MLETHEGPADFLLRMVIGIIGTIEASLILYWVYALATAEEPYIRVIGWGIITISTFLCVTSIVEHAPIWLGGIQMANKVRKSEHCGAKHGNGAHWGTKEEAKEGAKKLRRADARKEILDVELEPELRFIDFKELHHPTGAKYGPTNLSLNSAHLLIDGGVWSVMTCRDREDGTGRTMDVTIGYPSEAEARAAFEACE